MSDACDPCMECGRGCGKFRVGNQLLCRSCREEADRPTVSGRRMP